jgi:dTDP-4-amino-4,6-dideoxygalactose transaminase
MIVSPERQVDFASPSIGDREIEEVIAVLTSEWLSTGPRVARFEREFAAHCHAPYAVAVNSCTAALHLSLLAAGVGPGDEVITSPLTFCATANAIVHVGATPIFADVEPGTMNLCPDMVRAAVTPLTRALLPVHFAGRPAKSAAFREITERNGLVLIEDAAHAVEAVTSGARVGSVADFTCFSFYGTNSMTTSEGGMVTTGPPEWAERIKVASLHGMSRDAWSRYAHGGPSTDDVVMPGFDYNMTDLQAALGLHQLAGLERRLARREAIWRMYDDGLASLPLTLPPPVPARDRHARHLYTVLVDEEEGGWSRDELQAALRARGIATSVHFRAVHLHSFYHDRYGLKKGMFPVAESISARTLSLPLSAALGDEDVERVIEALQECLR